MAPSAGGDRLSALSHCTRGGTISYGPARKPLPAKAPESVPASAFDTPLFAATQEPEPLPQEGEGFDVVDEGLELPAEAATTRPRYLGQYFGNCVARLDSSSERASLAPPLPSGEPKAKAYTPAKTLGQGVAPSYHHPPKWSFGGGKSRCDSPEPIPRSQSTGSLASLRNRPSKRRTLSRGFGGASRGDIVGRGTATPGPAAYNLHRVCDKEPSWSSSARVPWGNRTGSRSENTLQVSEVGPGEFTAHHGIPFGPTAKIGQRLKEMPDSRIDYPAAGHYKLKPTVGRRFSGGSARDECGQGSGAAWSMGAGSRSNLTQESCGPGFLYHPKVEPTSHGATWSQGERRSMFGNVDPDDPPGPGAYNLRREYLPEDTPSTGWPKEEGRKLAGMLPDYVPAPNEYRVPSERLGKDIQLHGRIAPLKQDVKPAPTDYRPKTDLVKHSGGNPRPLHRTDPRKSPFDISVAGLDGEAILKRALKSLDDRPKDDLAEKYDRTTPSWTLQPRNDAKMREAYCDNLYGPWSSFG